MSASEPLHELALNLSPLCDGTAPTPQVLTQCFVPGEAGRLCSRAMAAQDTFVALLCPVLQAPRALLCG